MASGRSRGITVEAHWFAAQPADLSHLEEDIDKHGPPDALVLYMPDGTHLTYAHPPAEEEEGLKSDGEPAEVIHFPAKESAV